MSTRRAPPPNVRVLADANLLKDALLFYSRSVGRPRPADDAVGGLWKAASAAAGLTGTAAQTWRRAASLYNDLKVQSGFSDDPSAEAHRFNVIMEWWLL